MRIFLNKLVTVLLQIVMMFYITGCSSNFKLLDNANKPVKGAIVISEIADYIMQKWTVQIDVSDDNGEANYLIGNNLVYKKGFHPIIKSNDIAGVVNQEEALFSPVSLKGTVNFYPIVSPAKYSYPMVSENISFDTANNNSIPINVKHCQGVTALYSTKDDLITVVSRQKNLLGSSRFFYESASDTIKQQQLTNKSSLFFYCINSDHSIYKTGIRFRLNFIHNLHREKKQIATLSKVVMKSRVDSVNAYIEPAVKPTRPLQQRQYLNYKKARPKLVLEKHRSIILQAINENIPTRNSEERKLKEMLLQLIR